MSTVSLSNSVKGSDNIHLPFFSWVYICIVQNFCSSKERVYLGGDNMNLRTLILQKSEIICGKTNYAFVFYAFCILLTSIFIANRTTDEDVYFCIFYHFEIMFNFRCGTLMFRPYSVVYLFE